MSASPSVPAGATPRSFPIVGIGASAGGLEAIMEFLAEVTTDSGMAFLVVQHLDPTHPSMLSDILAKGTRLPVTQAVDGERIESDHVYVIPPNKSMVVTDGSVHLTPRGASKGPPMPIDDLLSSLAQDQGPNAIGIILSGGGTDGAIGMQAIKGYGGITFAQDERSARFSSMPQAARGTGCIDLSLPPAGIGQELMRVGRHPYLENGAAAERGDGDDAWRKLFRMLRTSCDVDFTHYKRGTVERRLARRLALHGVEDLPAYLKVLDGNPAEGQELCRDLLIRYTEFFRDPDAFDALTTTALPRLLQGGGTDASLRVWVPGCASGEEVYSIAICLTEYMASLSLTNPVQIFGTDISDEALAKARAGRYIENIARNVSAERLNRFFVRDGDHFHVSKPIRDLCTFARHNVAYDPPFLRIDLVSCRNLLIYLDPVLQKRVLPAFHFALQPDGVLMLGQSETIGPHDDLFSVLDSGSGKLFGKKAVASRAVFGPGLPVQVAASRFATARALPDASADLDDALSTDALRREIDGVASARYAPALVLCDEGFNVLEFRGDSSAFLVNPPGAPTPQLPRLARPGVLLAVTDALRRVRDDGAPSAQAPVQGEVGGRPRAGRIEVVPLRATKGRSQWFIVFFTLDGADGDTGPQATPRLWQALKAALVARLSARASAPDTAAQAEVKRLTAEVESGRTQLRLLLQDHENVTSQLKAFGEELLSSNEEFQSTNEELETAKEELQSLNEELSTTNDELRYRHRELKVVHDEATRARDYADALIETVSQPMLVLDAELRVVRANQAYYTVFKAEVGATLHARFYDLGSGQWDTPPVRELIDEQLPRKMRVRDHEVTADFPGLGMRTMKLTAARVTWPEHVLVLLMIDDITESHAAVETLKANERQRNEFLAMLAHELRNPLAAMNNALHLWRRDGTGTAQQQQAQAMLERQLHSQVRLVDDLLDASRISRGVITLQMRRVDLAQTVRNALEELRDRTAARGQNVTLALPAGALHVDGDPQRLQQIVVNLLGNAIKYTDARGHIEVALRHDSGQAVLTVTDSGIGMTREFLGRIFTMFVQADRATDKNYGGLGVGLAIVRRLAELHGGSVTAESRGTNMGSQFIVRLPAAKNAEAEATGNGRESVEPPAAKPRRILVVDDNADAAQSTATLLEYEGHEVHVANDGPSALRAVQSLQPAVVLLDIGMPGMDGYEVCRQIRGLPQQGSTLIIAVSGFGQRADLESARRAGFNHHLTKPAEVSAITEVLRASE